MNLRVKWTFLVLVLLLFGYYLLPTIRYYSMDEASRGQIHDPAVTKIRDNAMKLGLDLRGGAFLVYDVDLSKIPPKDRRGDEVDRAIEIIRNRIDQYGVTEPVIQKEGENRIVVQLPGLNDPARAKDLIGKTARLEFRLVKTRQEMLQGLSKIDQLVAGRRGTAGADSAMMDSLFAADSTAADSLLASRNPFTSLLQQAGADAGYAFCPDTQYDRARKWWEEVAFDRRKDQPVVMPGGTIYLWGQKVGEGTPNSGRYLYALDATPDLTGDRVADAQVAFGLEPSRPNAAGVSLTLDKRGGAIFTRLTGNNVGRQLAIILDNTVNSAPVIRDKIRGGRASITGLANDDEARDLGIVLRAGALPTDLILQQELSVSPSLGKDSIEKGVRAALLGTALVVVFMCIYYRLSGILAVVALSLNIFFLIATLGMLRGTLTLPGLAGIVLTVGMAVDANVLILERVREELRNGKTVRGAIDAGYGRALVTIIDSNLTTLISAVVLFQFGTGPIKGFATTLIIGLVANVFTAVFVTKLIYDSIMAKRPIQKLSI